VIGDPLSAGAVHVITASYASFADKAFVGVEGLTAQTIERASDCKLNP
jgi:hypothetical protein